MNVWWVLYCGDSVYESCLLTIDAGEYSPTLRRIVHDDERNVIMLELSMAKLLTDLNAIRTMGKSMDSGSRTKEEEQRRRREENCLQLPALVPASTVRVHSTAMSLM
jgi:hypothetical protein